MGYEKYNPYGNYDPGGLDPNELLNRLIGQQRLIHTLIQKQESVDGQLVNFESEISQNAEQILLRVTQTTFDNLETRVSEAESSITLNAEQIALKVSQIDFDNLSNTVSTQQTAITQNANSITLQATEIEGIDTRVSAAESSITLNAEQIALKVSETDYDGNTIISLINQTSTSVDILAERINLVGAVTYSMLDNNLQTQIDNGSSDSRVDLWQYPNTTYINGGYIYTDTVTANAINVSELSAISADLGNIYAGYLYGVVIEGGVIQSNTDINVTRDVYVGQNIYLQYEYANRFNEKGIIFYDGPRYSSFQDSRIVGTYLKLDIINNNAINVMTDVFEINATSTRVRDGISFTGDQPIQSVSETGYCGAGGKDPNGSTSAVAGQGVNFKVKKSYTPSSISLSTIASNASPSYTSINQYGFWLYVGGGTANTYYYWRGNYTA